MLEEEQSLPPNDDHQQQPASGRRTFSEETKTWAVEQMIAGKRTAEIAQQLGVRENLLGRWKKQYLEQKKASKKDSKVAAHKTPTTPAAAPQKPAQDHTEELVKLRQEVRQLRSDNSALRAALAVLARDGF